jgi:outer membrane protein
VTGGGRRTSRPGDRRTGVPADARRAVPVVIATLLAFVLPVSAVAQSVPARLTVEDAIEIAQGGSPSFLQVANDEDVAAAQLRARYGAFLPSLNTSVGFSGTTSRTLRAFGNFGEPLDRPEPLTAQTSSASQGVSMSMTLFDGGQNMLNVGAARAGVDAAAARVSGQRMLLRAEVSRLYFAAVRAEQRVTLERQLLRLVEERLELMDRQFRIAVARQTDVLGAQADLAASRQSLADAEAAARTARLDLLQAMGVAGDAEFELISDLPETVDPAALAADVLVARALAGSPLVLGAAAAAQQTARQASAARGARLPTITANFIAGRGTSEQGFWSAWGEMGPQNRSAQFGLSANLPIFQRFQTSSTITQARVAAEDARHEERRIRLQVERDVRAAVVELGRAHAALRQAETRAELSALRLELAEEEYQAGATSFTVLQQIVSANEQAQRAVVDARFGYAAALITLERHLGGPLAGS